MSSKTLKAMSLPVDCLTGKTAVVTGGAMGIGKAVASGLYALGARVAVIDKDASALQATEQTSAFDPERYMSVVANIGEDGAFANAIAKIESQWHHIDILVNNAAESFIGSHEEESREIWDQLFDCNLRHPATVIKSLLPKMRENGEGVIVNVISLEGLAYSSAYSATKVGMRSLTTSIANEIGPDSGVSIFAFTPGIVDTPLVNTYFYPELAKRFGMTMQDIINGIGGNPGYPDLMPVDDCAAGLIYCIAHHTQYHGQVTSPFIPLAKAGVIGMDAVADYGRSSAASKDEKGLEFINASLRDYLKSMSEVNKSLEILVAERTRELQNANQKLQALAQTDSLTRTATRRYFFERLQIEWDRGARDKKPLAIILFDVDHFKTFNDRHGHVAGDDCLSKIAEVAKSALKRPGDLLGRYGGEEFIIMLPDTGLDGAAEVAERMRSRIETTLIPLRDDSTHVTASFGYADITPNHQISFSEIIAEADSAMYRAKRAGRNCVMGPQSIT